MIPTLRLSEDTLSLPILSRKDNMSQVEAAVLPSSKFYAIKVGRKCGIFRSWAEAQVLVKGFSGAKYKSFTSEEDATKFMEDGASHPVKLVPLRAASGSSGGKERIVGEKRKRSSHKETDAEVEEVISGEVLEIFTDGSCPDNGANAKSAGCGVWFGSDDDPRNVCERLPLRFWPPTNNAAELYAIQLALENFLRLTQFDTLQRPMTLLIRTDSKYARDCVKLAPSQKQRQWKLADGHSDVKNRTIIESIVSLLEAEVPGNINVVLRWVRGHSTSIGNNKADALASKAAQKAVS